MEEKEFELWAIGYDENERAVDFCELIGDTVSGEEARNELCKKMESLTAEDLINLFGLSLKRYGVQSIRLQVEELDLTDQEFEEEGNIYLDRIVDLPKYDWSKDYNPDCEYELWVTGFNGDLILPLEEQIGEVAINREEFLELMKEAETITAETLIKMFDKQIKESKITSLQLTVEERIWSDEDDSESEPIFERFFSLEPGCKLNFCPYGGDETDDCADCAYAGDYHFVDGECLKRED